MGYIKRKIRKICVIIVVTIIVCCGVTVICTKRKDERESYEETIYLESKEAKGNDVCLQLEGVLSVQESFEEKEISDCEESVSVNHSVVEREEQETMHLQTMEPLEDSPKENELSLETISPLTTEVPINSSSPADVMVPVETIAPAEPAPSQQEGVLEPEVCMHDFKKSIWENPTCMNGGYYNNICQKCGLVECVALEALSHEIEDVVVQEGNCMEDTVIRHVCTLCGQQIGSDTRYTPQDHAWTKEVVDGKEVECCNLCGVVK